MCLLAFPFTQSHDLTYNIPLALAQVSPRPAPCSLATLGQASSDMGLSTSCSYDSKAIPHFCGLLLHLVYVCYHLDTSIPQNSYFGILSPEMMLLACGLSSGVEPSQMRIVLF